MNPCPGMLANGRRLGWSSLGELLWRSLKQLGLPGALRLPVGGKVEGDRERPECDGICHKVLPLILWSQAVVPCGELVP